MLYNHIGAAMSRILLPLSVACALTGATAFADVPKVTTDIAAVHSLVARVMDGVGEPALVIPPEASPHEYNLRPSEAQAIQDADVIFWMGEGLTPWLEDALDTLAANAEVTTLLELEETILLDFRESALFEAHDHDHDAHGDEDHGEHHDEHAEEKHGDHDEHDHGDHDPHAWLSPENAGNWLNVIAAKLSSADPDNAGAYFANAAAAREELEILTSDIKTTLDPVRGRSFIVFHDAYQYFERDFEFPAAGAISVGDAADPSPARIAEIQARIRADGIDCVLAEPQFNPGIVATILDGTEANTGVIDPHGATLEPGAALYPQLIRNMAQTLAECL
jgi:zinc transport system substrate-binding protein